MFFGVPGYNDSINTTKTRFQLGVTVLGFRGKTEFGFQEVRVCLGVRRECFIMGEGVSEVGGFQALVGRELCSIYKGRCFGGFGRRV